MHLTDRCRFLNCSVRMGGGGLVGALRYEFVRLLLFQGPKKSRFQGPPLHTALVMDFPPPGSFSRSSNILNKHMYTFEKHAWLGIRILI